MTNIELNSIADGLFLYLKEKSESPLDAIAILGITIIKIYTLQEGMANRSFDQFAEDFKAGLIATHGDVSDSGSGTLQ